MPTISLCMIVRNESKRLDACLMSAKRHVDEMIVVDTGSTDKTVEIAESHGAKVYRHAWEDNFSKARNIALSYAMGDWILVLDADEVLESGGETLHMMAEQLPLNVACVMFKLVNVVEDGHGETFIWHPRMFRNHRGFQYTGRVHNRPEVVGDVARCDSTIKHFGYAEDAATMEERYKRRVKMIGRWVEDEPNNGLARSYLAHVYSAKPETLDKSVRLAKEAIVIHNQNKASKLKPHAFYPLILSLYNLGKYDECLAAIGTCTHEFPWFADPFFFAAKIFTTRKDWDAANSACQLWFMNQARVKYNDQNYVYVENMTASQTDPMLAMWGQAIHNIDK